MGRRVRTGIAYVSFAIPCLLVHAAVGIAARRRGGALTSSVLAGLAVALFDASVAWWVAWQIGPGRLPLATASDGFVFLLTFKVALMANTIVALIAGAAWGAVAGRQ